MTDRIYVTCPECGWAGQRAGPGGPCPECETPLVDQRDRKRGLRTKWTLSVLEETRETFSAREAAEVLDRAAKRRRA